MTTTAFPIYTCLVGVAATPAERPDSLDGIDTTPLESGAFGWVRTGAAATRLFRLDKTSAAVPDGVTIIQPLTGPGRWLEFSEGSNGGVVSTDYVARAEIPSNGSTSNTTAQATYTGGSFFLERPVSFNRIVVFLPNRTPPFTGRVLLYQADGGDIVTDAALRASTVFTDVGGGRAVLTPAEGTVELVPGVYWALFGQDSGGGTYQLRTFGQLAFNLYNSDVAAGEHPVNFTTTIAANTVPATIDPFVGGADGFAATTAQQGPVHRLITV